VLISNYFSGVNISPPCCFAQHPLSSRENCNKVNYDLYYTIWLMFYFCIFTECLERNRFCFVISGHPICRMSILACVWLVALLKLQLLFSALLWAPEWYLVTNFMIFSVWKWHANSKTTHSIHNKWSYSFFHMFRS
jgi:hypothetical protein